MYKELELNHFKQFEHMKMTLAPVTLIGGSNNVGKTSILEALFLAHGFLDPSVFTQIKSFRGSTVTAMVPRAIWGNLFHKYDETKKLSLRLDEQELVFQKEDGFSSGVAGIKSSNVKEYSYALASRFTKRENTYNGFYFIGEYADGRGAELFLQDNLDINAENAWLKLCPARYQSSTQQLSIMESSVFLSDLELSNSKAHLVDVLKIIDEDIVDVQMLTPHAEMVIYLSKKDGTKVPVSDMGDGIKKLLNIAMSMLSQSNHILFLDEIENGIHHSLFPKLWEAIFVLAKKQHCQVIATTHSYECVRGAAMGAQLSKLPNDLLYTRLERLADTISAKTYTTHILNHALDANWEVR